MKLGKIGAHKKFLPLFCKVLRHREVTLNKKNRVTKKNLGNCTFFCRKAHVIYLFTGKTGDC